MTNKKINFFFPLISIVTIVVAYIPMILLGENSFVIIDDNLDDLLLHKYLLSSTDNLFNLDQDTIIHNVLGGLKLSFIHTQFNLLNVAFLFFNFLDAYIINSIILRIIGFISMFYFINKNFKIDNIFTSLISLSWAFLPTYTNLGLTIFGLPIIAIAFYDLSKSQNLLRSYFLIFFFSAYSLIMYSLPFLVLAIITIYIINYKRIKPLHIITGLSFYVLVSICLNFYMIDTILSNESSDLTHRVLRSQRELSLPSLIGVVFNFLKQFIFGSGKVNSLLISIPILLISCYYLIKSKQKKQILYLYYSIFFLITVSATYQYAKYFFGEYVPILYSLDFAKIINLNSFIFYLILVISIAKILKFNDINKSFLIILLILQCSLNYVRNPEFAFNGINGVNYNLDQIYNEDKFFKQFFYGKDYNIYEKPFYNKLTFEEYLSRDLFDSIKKYINKQPSEYRVISFGLDPSVSILNDFYTLDGYFNNHSLEYHLDFEKIQEDYIERNFLDNKLILKNKKLNSICTNCTINDKITLKYDLEINYEHLKNLGAEFVFSSVIINNPNNLNFLKKFNDSRSPYTVYLYKLNK